MNNLTSTAMTRYGYPEHLCTIHSYAWVRAARTLGYDSFVRLGTIHSYAWVRFIRTLGYDSIVRIRTDCPYAYVRFPPHLPSPKDKPPLIPPKGGNSLRLGLYKFVKPLS